MARQEVLSRPNRCLFCQSLPLTFVRLCALSQELDTKAPPWTRPAGGFFLPGDFPCGELFPYGWFYLCRVGTSGALNMYPALYSTLELSPTRVY